MLVLGNNKKLYTMVDLGRIMPKARFAEIDRLFELRYDNARNPVNITLKNRIQMKQEAYETKKDDYLGVTFAPKHRRMKKPYYK